VSEFITSPGNEDLSKIIRTICNGGNAEEMICQFDREHDDLSEEVVAEVFQALGQEGVEFQNHPQVIDFYHSVIVDKVAAGVLNQFAPVHPVRVYLEENALLRSLFIEIDGIDPGTDLDGFNTMFQSILKVEKHFVRKENQLFPCLEKHGWDSPSKNMWALHDDIRARLKEVRLALEQENAAQVAQKFPSARDELVRLMAVEEERLLPNAMNMLEESEWEAMRTGDEEIGWMLDETPPPYPPRAEDEEYVHPSLDTRKRELDLSTEASHYDEGYLTPEQVNMIFKFLPIDVTYVDENDRVVFYNRGEDRVFPRSAGIIGREVRYCHPPKSVDQVLRILEEFKKGTQDVADFRIHFKGRYILIRYFAVRDNDKNYRGVLEMSQDITDIQQLEGEQRLLDWD